MPYTLESSDLSGNEFNHVLDCLRAGVIGGGTFRGRFEAALAAQIDAPHVFAVSHGAVALQVAFAALDLGPKDEVILPALAGSDIADAVRLAGGTPAFADTDPRTGCIRPDSVARLMGSRTRAVVASHWAGFPCDLDALRELTTLHGVWLIEDVGGALGATYRARRAGAIGDLAVFDFSFAGVVTTGQGGVVATRLPVLAERLRRVIDPGTKPRTGCSLPGFDCRMTNLAAAIGCAQVERLGELLASRRRVTQWYGDRLQLLPQLVPPPEGAFVGYSLLCPDRPTRDAIAAFLVGASVEAVPFPIPPHRTPAYRKCRTDGGCPAASDWSDRGMTLPAPSHLREEEVDLIVAQLRAALEALPGKLMLRRVAA